MASTTPLSVPRPAVAIRREQEVIEAESRRGVVTLRKNFDKNATQRQANILIKLIKDNWENVEIRKLAPKPFADKGYLIEGNDILVNIATMQSQLWADMTYTDIAEFHTFIPAYKQYGERNEYHQLLSALKSYFLDLWPEKKLPVMVDWATPENTNGLDNPNAASEHNPDSQGHPIEDADNSAASPAPPARTLSGRKAGRKRGAAPQSKKSPAPKSRKAPQPKVHVKKRAQVDDDDDKSDNEPLVRKRGKVPQKKGKTGAESDEDADDEPIFLAATDNPVNGSDIGAQDSAIKVELID
ncbi:hypothetical protein C1H76_2339 [Elsinoe australis]|uniref:Uncharacterized protein n=1 Tax=Elsinoe australis TaxID=40998 RepID=A0A4U7B470_9PEZI|nr:hypothetical protein C1H76_2339 [Elsinoe australis]